MLLPERQRHKQTPPAAGSTLVYPQVFVRGRVHGRQPLVPRRKVFSVMAYAVRLYQCALPCCLPITIIRSGRGAFPEKQTWYCVREKSLLRCATHEQLIAATVDRKTATTLNDK